MMERFNLNNRLLMFAVCTSIEYDLRNFISNNKPVIGLPNDFVEKARTRNSDSTSSSKGTSDEYEILIELDLGDLVSFIIGNHSSFRVNLEEKSKMKKIFDKIIPIRNRVMHSRPLEFADRSTLEEALNIIDEELPKINWKQVKETRKLILENPQQLLMEVKPTVKDDTTKIYHNLPLPEFDDTGFVGRKKEISDLKGLILNKKSQIITIIGNGGIGKTAIAIKCLYDIVDDPEHQDRFDAIVWVSLKTKSLTKGEFINIKGAIHSVEGMYKSLQKSTVEDSDSPVDDILSFMQNFNTLLVIDNLETVTAGEILNFLKSIPDNSKVLITSRSGVGELETRFRLSEMSLKDSEQYFRLLCQYYGLELYKRDKDSLRQLLTEDLYSSPLSIKWFVTSIYFKTDEASLLAHKDNLIHFSMSNIIDKLNSSQKEILHLFLLEGKPLVFGVIDFYMDKSTYELAEDINVLQSTSMLDSKSNTYQINSMAKDYLSLYNKPSNDFIKKVSKKRSELSRILQNIQLEKEASPFFAKIIFGNLETDNKKISSFYLKQALQYSADKRWKEAEESVERAREVAPDYFEVYKIKAYINAENMNLYEAIESYRTAVENANKGYEKATVLYLFSIFYRNKMDDYESAYQEILEAEKNYPDSKEILLEKARVLIFLVRYEEAEMALKSIDITSDEKDRFKNQYISRYADLYIRKGSQFKRRDYKKRLELLEKAIELIEDLETIDGGTASILIKALNDLSFLSFDLDAKQLLEKKIQQHFSLIVNNTNNVVKKLKTAILEHSESYSVDVVNLAKRLGVNYDALAQEITEDTEGIIVTIKYDSGFVKNSNGSFYFSLDEVNFLNPIVGDRVSFEYEETPRGKNAKNLNFIVEK